MWGGTYTLAVDDVEFAVAWLGSLWVERPDVAEGRLNVCVAPFGRVRGLRVDISFMPPVRIIRPIVFLFNATGSQKMLHTSLRRRSFGHPMIHPRHYFQPQRMQKST